MKRTTPQQTLAVSISYWLFIGLLAYMPLHILLSTWIGTSWGILETMKVLKDVVMFTGFLLLLTTSLKKDWFVRLLHTKLLWLIVAYGALTLLLAAIRPTDNTAEVLGVVYNTRFLVFFLYGLLLYHSVDYLRLRKHALMAVLGSALFVLVFGILQYTVIPNNALTHLGYQRSNGVLPAFFIDDKPDLERIMSTLRDPNSFGSYVIIIGSIALVMLLKKVNYRRLAAGFTALSVLCLWFSFSRSAWLGFTLSCLMIATLVYKDKISSKQAKRVLVLGGVTVVVFIGLVALFKNSYFIQNVVFHADKNTVLEDPNQLRIRFWKESVSSVVHNPAGGGPGTAGIVSIRTGSHGKLNENYYLQIASEVGVLGLLLFLAILILVGLKLYVRVTNDWLALALLASLAGLLLTNFLVHIWSNEAVAYTWWGLAGLCVIIGKKPAIETKSKLHF